MVVAWQFSVDSCFMYWRISFSLRTLFFVTAVICALCALISVRIRNSRRQDAALLRVKEMGGRTVRYPAEENWLHRILSDDFFVEQVGVALNASTNISPFGVEECPTRLLHSFEDGALFEELGSLNGLVELHLDGREIDDRWIKEAAALKQVERLNLRNVTLTGNGCFHLSKMRSVKSLELLNVEVSSEGWGHLSKMTGLRTLSLNMYRLTTVPTAALSGFASTGAVERIEMGLLVYVKPGGLRALANSPSLTFLHVSVRDEHIDALLEFRNLKTLEIHDCWLSSGGVERLKKGMPNVEIIGAEPYSIDKDARENPFL